MVDDSNDFLREMGFDEAEIADIERRAKLKASLGVFPDVRPVDPGESVDAMIAASRKRDMKKRRG